MNAPVIRRRVLGIDYGKGRIGLAVSDELGMLAHPLETLPADRHAVARIAAVVREKDVARIIVGLPRHMSGDAGQSAQDATAFAELLRAAVHCDVMLQDERLTSVAAQRALHASGRKVRDSRRVIDQVAAQMILQTYLDSLNVHAAETDRSI